MHYIKQVMSGEVEDWVHDRFVRYGRGEFEGPSLTVSKKVGGVKVSCSWDYVTAFAGILAETSRDVKIKGSVFAKRDISDVITDFFTVSKEKKKKGVYSADVTGELDADAFKGLMVMIPDATLLVDATSGKNNVKSKKKLPKPGGKQNEKFASANFEDGLIDALRDEFLFDVKGKFTEVSVSHRYIIEDIIPPEGVTDSSRIRLEATRKGKLERTVIVDGRKEKTVCALLV